MRIKVAGQASSSSVARNMELHDQNAMNRPESKSKHVKQLGLCKRLDTVNNGLFQVFDEVVSFVDDWEFEIDNTYPTKAE